MPQIFHDVACTRCGCVCDDLTLHVAGNRIERADRACSLSEPWLLGLATAQRASVQVDGKEADFAEGVCQAAEVLAESRAPLIYGMSTSSTAGQRAACELADRLGATIDPTASTCRAASILALQAVGESTASLGEVRNRADLVIYWGSNPVESHPRHLERCVDAPGLFVPCGRSDRRLVVVDTQRTPTAELADDFVQVEPGSDFDILWALRALVQGKQLEVDSVGGLTRQQLVNLAEQLRSCRYGAVFFGHGLTGRTVPQATVEALLSLVTDLNAHTRFVACRMGMHGDSASADSVLCWQTGFPFGVNLARGYPRYNPGEYTARELLERSEVDAAVLVGSEGIDDLPEAARRRLADIPVILLENASAEYSLPHKVRFATAIDGVHRPGTTYRMDDVPIPLRKIVPSKLPSDEEVLQAILRSLKDAG